MAESFKKPHLKIQGYSENQDYKYPNTKIRVDFKKPNLDRSNQGNRVLLKLNEVRKTYNLLKDTVLTDEVDWDNVIYIQFISPWGYELKYEQLHSDAKKTTYRLLNIQREIKVENGEEVERFRALVMLKEGGISHFINRVEKYLTENTIYKGKDTGNPVANDLISNIDELKIATLEAFWTDSQSHSFPKLDEEVWWEVWLRKEEGVEDKAIEQLNKVKAQIGESRLEFKENIVRLVKATANQLSVSLLFLDSLSELRKPQILNDFITHDNVTYADSTEWLTDLLNRTRININNDEDDVLVSVFDSGINNVHPLLENVIPDSYLETWKPNWGKGDSEPRGGHGTGMAGLILYGNLSEALATSSNINIYHGVESFKICHPSEKTDPKLYGVIYENGCDSLIADRPKNKRVFCLAVTNDGVIKSGRPSSGSTRLDEIIFGNLHDESEAQLFLVSGGNVVLSKPDEYPNLNFIASIQDPGQAYNALTIGAYTLMDKLSSSKHSPVAKYGTMSPFNSTSAAWETQWPNKPDIVFEGGNMIIDQFGTLSTHEELSPVSLDSDFKSNLFTPFNATSSATAFGSKMAAELRRVYPNYWPETIRGLMVHSADWTENMLKEYNIKNENERRALIRSVGYGVPNLENALLSANNSLTMIAEESIIPFKKVGSTVKYNHFHLYKLPWPKDILLNDVSEKYAKITITLSYFIEPNPGGKEYARSFSYHSHELEFKLIKSGESIEEFTRRISSASEDEEVSEVEDKPNLITEEWTIKERIRSKGSIKKDFLETTGAELSDRYYLAVYPKNGWYRTRKKLEKYNSEVRYSLILSIETTKQGVDIYTPVENIIKTAIPLTSI